MLKSGFERYAHARARKTKRQSLTSGADTPVSRKSKTNLTLVSTDADFIGGIVETDKFNESRWSY